MTGKLAFADYFAPAFQHAVPEAQFKTITANLVAQYGQPVAVESASSTDGRQGTVKLRFEKGVGTIALAVGAGPDQRVEGLRIQNVVMADDSFDRVATELAAPPGATGFLVAEVAGAATRPIAAANAARTSNPNTDG